MVQPARGTDENYINESKHGGVAGIVRRPGEGEVLVMPQGTKHSSRGAGPALLLEVSRPSVRGDNFFRDERVVGTGVI